MQTPFERRPPEAAATALAVALLTLGCQADLATCDLPAAQRPAYDEATGLAAFEGQALLIRGCGAGAFCHADGVEAEDRFGAPAGLDLDLLPVAVDGTVDEEASARLARNQWTALRERHRVFASVASGWMPILSGAGADVADAAPAYVRVDPDSGDLQPLPELGTADAKEILRNWLACDAPVVARPEPRDDGRASVGFIVPSRSVAPLEAEWADIYERLVAPRCSSTLCHGAGRDSQAGLDLVGRDDALARLLGGAANTDREESACADSGMDLLVAGNPEQSLFYRKLTGEPGCGDRMPLEASAVREESLAAIRAWIVDLE
ncbi:MAG: hypothetical protein ACFCGT_02515 [Sandaracinaceae bacterium]